MDNVNLDNHSHDGDAFNCACCDGTCNCVDVNAYSDGELVETEEQKRRDTVQWQDQQNRSPQGNLDPRHAAPEPIRGRGLGNMVSVSPVITKQDLLGIRAADPDSLLSAPSEVKEDLEREFGDEDSGMHIEEGPDEGPEMVPPPGGGPCGCAGECGHDHEGGQCTTQRNSYNPGDLNEYLTDGVTPESHPHLHDEGGEKKKYCNSCKQHVEADLEDSQCYGCGKQIPDSPGSPKGYGLYKHVNNTINREGQCGNQYKRDNIPMPPNPLERTGSAKEGQVANHPVVGPANPLQTQTMGVQQGQGIQLQNSPQTPQSGGSPHGALGASIQLQNSQQTPQAGSPHGALGSGIQLQNSPQTPQPNGAPYGALRSFNSSVKEAHFTDWDGSEEELDNHFIEDSDDGHRYLAGRDDEDYEKFVRSELGNLSFEDKKKIHADEHNQNSGQGPAVALDDEGNVSASRFNHNHVRPSRAVPAGPVEMMGDRRDRGWPHDASVKEAQTVNPLLLPPEDEQANPNPNTLPPLAGFGEALQTTVGPPPTPPAGYSPSDSYVDANTPVMPETTPTDTTVDAFGTTISAPAADAVDKASKDKNRNKQKGNKGKGGKGGKGAGGTLGTGIKAAANAALPSGRDDAAAVDPQVIYDNKKTKANPANLVAPPMAASGTGPLADSLNMVGMNPADFSERTANEGEKIMSDAEITETLDETQNESFEKEAQAEGNPAQPAGWAQGNPVDPNAYPNRNAELIAIEQQKRMDTAQWEDAQNRSPMDNNNPAQPLGWAVPEGYTGEEIPGQGADALQVTASAGCPGGCSCESGAACKCEDCPKEKSASIKSEVHVLKTASNVIGGIAYLADDSREIAGEIVAADGDEFGVKWDDGQTSIEKQGNFELVVHDADPKVPNNTTARVFLDKEASTLNGAEVVLESENLRVAGVVVADSEDEFWATWEDGVSTVEAKPNYELVIKTGQTTTLNPPGSGNVVTVPASAPQWFQEQKLPKGVEIADWNSAWQGYLGDYNKSLENATTLQENQGISFDGLSDTPLKSGYTNVEPLDSSYGAETRDTTVDPKTWLDYNATSYAPGAEDFKATEQYKDIELGKPGATEQLNSSYSEWANANNPSSTPASDSGDTSGAAETDNPPAPTPENIEGWTQATEENVGLRNQNRIENAIAEGATDTQVENMVDRAENRLEAVQSLQEGEMRDSTLQNLQANEGGTYTQMGASGEGLNQGVGNPPSDRSLVKGIESSGLKAPTINAINRLTEQNQTSGSSGSSGSSGQGASGGTKGTGHTAGKE